MAKSKNDIVKLVLEQQQRKALEARARRLAAALMLRAGVNPHGIDLVCWLAHSGCRDNREAMVVWTLRTLMTEKLPIGAEEHAECLVLLRRLQNRLAEVSSSYANDG